MTKARWVRLVAGLFVLSLVVAACSSDDDGGGTTDTTGGATGTTAETGSSGGGTTITIAGFAFDPDTITVSGPTEVTVTNDVERFVLPLAPIGGKFGQVDRSLAFAGQPCPDFLRGDGKDGCQQARQAVRNHVHGRLGRAPLARRSV